MTRKLILAALSASLVAGAFGTAALAARQNADRPLPPMARPAAFVFMLKNFDADKNGTITADEAKAGADTLFAKIDTDKDGAVTPKELRAWREARRAEMKAAMKGGSDAPDDAMGGPDGGDGPDSMAGPDGQPMKHGWGKGMRHHGKGHHGMMGPGMMRALDTDENGQISKAEAEAGAANLVKRMDTNQDGSVSIDDFPG
ncbi:EF-hand domain-containing protein [Gellertiella hungarica]|uniref:Ca2+-binding EF-hand superfamily protein n=1 Tax=Gellertiella hungarica TaxID=1572859 RepID=A0A7W6NK20_9HYPH|nr:EF-hand domain-containing protein [Gellertiella hungarica]MBB4063832.1 Ca2+-binding EF-hand superfamily protein [Gellertiella hungarica]